MRKNYKRIRLARHIERELEKLRGEPVIVNPDDFELPYGAWRTDVRLDVRRWEVVARLTSLPRVIIRIGSYDTLSECANGITLQAVGRGSHGYEATAR